MWSDVWHGHVVWITQVPHFHFGLVHVVVTCLCRSIQRGICGRFNLVSQPPPSLFSITPYFLNMSDAYWPKATPTAFHVDYIVQVKYTIWSKNSTYFQVKQTNIHDEITDHRVYLPTRYQDFLVVLLWRLELIIRLHNKFKNSRKKKFKSFRPMLLRIMAFLDNVIEATLRPAVDIPRSSMDTWRNPNFEHYIVAEFLSGRHEPSMLRKIRSRLGVNLERMDFEEFGES